jgi:predicted Zn-dependent protease
MRVKAAAALAMTALSFGACATNPATGKRQLMLMSEQDEIQLGRESDVEVRKEMGLYNDARLAQYIEGVGQRLAHASHRPALPWHFTVVDTPAVNAFALPGGYIYITRGILPFLRDESELAAVLGHEVGHVDARHSAAAYSKQVLAGGGLAALGVFVPQTRPFQQAFGVGFGLLFLKNSRENELEADHLGVGYASTSGWDPGGMPGLLGTLARMEDASGSSRGVPNWALTHPQAEDRVVRVQETVAAARVGGGTATNRHLFEPHLDGLVFGDSREQGIVRGSEFLHPILRFALRFPAGWEIANSAAAVTASEGQNSSVAMVLEPVENPVGSVEQAARANMSKAGFAETSGQRVDINGLPAFLGTYDGTIDKRRVLLRAAHIQVGREIYLLAGVVPASSSRAGAEPSPQEFARADSAFLSSIRSFRPLSQQEADRVQPNRIDFRAVRPGETWESLARAVGDGTVKPSVLAIMNGFAPVTPPPAADRIRIVTGG